jgi:hypothetical protein
LSCDFQLDQCGYHNIHEFDNFEWERSARIDNNLFADHTTSSIDDSYMHINPETPFKALKSGDTAWLVSELVVTPASGCLKWWM